MSTYKNVLHIAPTPFFSDRGCHIRIEGIVRCLTKLGYDNLVCTYHHGHDIDGVKTERIGQIANYTNTDAGPSRYKFLADLKLLWLSLKQYRTLKRATIHAHLHEGLLIGLLVKLLFFWRRSPLIADMQGSLTGELETYGTFNKFPFLRWPLRQLERILLLFPNHIVCSSQHCYKKLKTDFGIKDYRISLVQDGADQAELLTPDAQATLRTKTALDHDKILVVYSGSLLESKGLNELKNIMHGLASYSPQLHFLVIGYPKENLQTYVEAHKLEQLCTLLGRVPFFELSRYLSIADIAIDPKSSDAGEGSGKMLNYLACGLPVVAFDTINNRYLLDDNALLASSIEDAVEHLLEYLNNPEMRKRVAARNLQNFEQMFSWDVSLIQLSSVYHTFVA